MTYAVSVEIESSRAVRIAQLTLYFWPVIGRRRAVGLAHRIALRLARYRVNGGRWSRIP